MPQLTAMNRRDRRKLAARGGNSAELAQQYQALAAHVGTIVARVAVGRRAADRLERQIARLNRKLQQRWRFWMLRTTAREKYRKLAAALGELSYNIRRDEAELKGFYADMLRMNQQGHAAMERERTETARKEKQLAAAAAAKDAVDPPPAKEAPCS